MDAITIRRGRTALKTAPRIEKSESRTVRSVARSVVRTFEKP